MQIIVWQSSVVQTMLIQTCEGMYCSSELWYSRWMAVVGLLLMQVIMLSCCHIVISHCQETSTHQPASVMLVGGCGGSTCAHMSSAHILRQLTCNIRACTFSSMGGIGHSGKVGQGLSEECVGSHCVDMLGYDMFLCQVSWLLWSCVCHALKFERCRML